MEGTMIIRIVAGALAVVVFLIILWRRRRQAAD